MACAGSLSVLPVQAATVLFLGDLDGDENGDGALELNAIADQVMISHLEDLPQVTGVVALDDSAVTPGDLENVDCVVISSTVFSGNVLTSFGGDGSGLFSLALPIVTMEPGLADDIHLNNFAGTQGQFPQAALDIEDPVMLDLPAGPFSIADSEVEVIHHASLDEFPGIPPDIPPIPPSLAPGGRAGASFFSPFAVRVASVVAVFAGRELADGSAAPGHRVGSFVGNGAFVSLNSDGLTLFNRVFALACPVAGDMDGDSDVDFDDINDFVVGLNDAELYDSMFGVPASLRGDTDQDRDLDFDDIEGFVGLLSPTVDALGASVPEPTALMLAASAVAAVLTWQTLHRRKLDRINLPPPVQPPNHRPGWS
jgi:hypothetical protein